MEKLEIRRNLVQNEITIKLTICSFVEVNSPFKGNKEAKNREW